MVTEIKSLNWEKLLQFCRFYQKLQIDISQKMQKIWSSQVETVTYDILHIDTHTLAVQACIRKCFIHRADQKTIVAKLNNDTSLHTVTTHFRFLTVEPFSAILAYFQIMRRVKWSLNCSYTPNLQLKILTNQRPPLEVT